MTTFTRKKTVKEISAHFQTMEKKHVQRFKVSKRLVQNCIWSCTQEVPNVYILKVKMTK